MNAEEQTQIREMFELSGLNEKQVTRILRDVGFIVNRIIWRNKRESEDVKSSERIESLKAIKQR